MANLPDLFRYHDYDDERTVKLRLTVYIAVRETPCGYWVIPKDWLAYGNAYIEKYKKWVSKTGRRRRCYPTKEQAMDSFLIRKHRQVGHLKRQLVQAEAACQLSLETGSVDKPSEFHWTTL